MPERLYSCANQDPLCLEEEEKAIRCTFLEVTKSRLVPNGYVVDRCACQPLVQREYTHPSPLRDLGPCAVTPLHTHKCAHVAILRCKLPASRNAGASTLPYADTT